MIVVDPPQRYQKAGLLRGRPFTSSHMISTLAGAEGRRELVAFGRRIGMREAWLQKPGTYLEHFDVMNSRYQDAIREGALAVGLAKTGQLMVAKRRIELVGRVLAACAAAGLPVADRAEIEERLAATEFGLLAQMAERCARWEPVSGVAGLMEALRA